MTLEQMNDLEAIRQLKARYFRLMDTQQWNPWTNCFTADVWASYEGRAVFTTIIGETRPSVVVPVRRLTAGNYASRCGGNRPY